MSIQSDELKEYFMAIYHKAAKFVEKSLVIYGNQSGSKIGQSLNLGKISIFCMYETTVYMKKLFKNLIKNVILHNK